MKKIFFIILAILLLVNMMVYSNVGNFEKTSLSGTITSNITGEPLSGVSIYLPDLKTGAITATDGTYKIDQLPKTKVLVQVTFIGYKMIAEDIDLNAISQKDFNMEASITELNEVVVTGNPKAAGTRRLSIPITVITPQQLLYNTSSNIIDAIASQPGISQITTGPGISKPVIRGLGYNRIILLNDGIRQEGQQWGDEHGIEIDGFTVKRVEILKGPASLSYGPDALAGVINFIAQTTLPNGAIEGQILTEYQTNNGLYAVSAGLGGNKDGFIWDLRFSDKMAHAYRNKYDGYVLNSGFKENAFTSITGFNKAWGYTHLHLSMYNITPGIVEGERDSATGAFIKPIILNDGTEGFAIASEHDYRSYQNQMPYQEINHYKAVLNSSFIIGNSTFKATLGWQQNRRKEFGNVLASDRYGLFFLLNTFNYEVRYIHPEFKGWNFSTGINGMGQNSQNKGTEFLVPAYLLFDAGLFVIASKSFDKLGISGGLRYDVRFEKGEDLFLDSEGNQTFIPDENSYQQFSAFKSVFSGFSGSLGTTYQINEKLTTKANASLGFRAPNIGEIGSNGVHEGTLRYELGDPELKPEQSIQLDYSLGFNTAHISASLDLFMNNIENYIYLRKLESLTGADSINNGYSTFKFVSGNASISGGEFTIDVHPHPLDWLHFENSFSVVRSMLKKQTDSTKFLPFTPADKLTSELKAEAGNLGKYFTKTFVRLGVVHYFKQSKFYAAYGTETATPAFSLWNLSVGADITSKSKTLVTMYIGVENVLNVASQNHLSRLKYAAVNNVTGRMGVYNMGRNFNFKIIVPVKYHKQ